MFADVYIPRIRVLQRPKLRGIGFHRGLQLFDGSVVHLTSARGAEHVSYQEFAQGRPVIVVREVDSRLYSQILRNARVALDEQRPYLPADWNCEHFVEALIGEEPKSETVSGLVWITLALVGLAIVARAGA